MQVKCVFFPLYLCTSEKQGQKFQHRRRVIWNGRAEKRDGRGTLKRGEEEEEVDGKGAKTEGEL